MGKWTSGVLLMLSVLVAGCVAPPPNTTLAPAWVANSPLDSKTIWGPYDGLAYRTWDTPGGYVLFYRWAVPQQVLVEEFRHPTTGELAGTSVIVPGATPGELLLNSSFGNLQWHGRVNGDSVLFVRDGMLEMPYRVSRRSDGTLLQEKVSLSGGQVSQVQSTTLYSPLGQPTPGVTTGVPAADQPTRDPVPSIAVTTPSPAPPPAPQVAAPAPQPEPEPAPTPSMRADATSEAEQDETVAAAMAQARQLAADIGAEAEMDAQAAAILAQVEAENARSVQPAKPDEPVTTGLAAGVERKTVKGCPVLVSAQLPKEVRGTYRYEGEGAPLIVLEPGANQFQPHDVPPIDIDVWVRVDANGRPMLEVGEGGHRYTLVVEYGAGGDGNYPPGSYDFFDVSFFKRGVASMLGERTRPATYVSPSGYAEYTPPCDEAG